MATPLATTFLHPASLSPDPTYGRPGCGVAGLTLYPDRAIRLEPPGGAAAGWAPGSTA